MATDDMSLFCDTHLPLVPPHIYFGLRRRYDENALKQSKEFMELARHAVAALIGRQNDLQPKRKGIDG